MEQEIVDENVSELKENIETSSELNESEESSFNWIWYLIGIICFLFAFTYLFEANTFLHENARMLTENLGGMDERYVGADAYNYIIAGTYSTTLTVRALVFALLGGISFLMGKK